MDAPNELGDRVWQGRVDATAETSELYHDGKTYFIQAPISPMQMCGLHFLLAGSR